MAEPIIVREELPELNDKFARLSLRERLSYISERWGNDVAMTSAFGYSGTLLLWYLREYLSAIDLYFIDTTYHFPETLKFVDRIEREWKLKITRIGTRKTPAEVEELIGVEAYKRDPDACCFVHKVEPLMEVLPRKKMWIHALRRDQSPSREKLDFVEALDDGNFKIYPLVDWTRDRCWAEIRQEGIPYHPLIDDGFPSIGCLHCTQRVGSGQHEREGRWNSFPRKLECGLHQRMESDKSGT
ncbi:MAG: phosphoadenylyl-sulfate reductase [Verrucomicrobiota bacterium]